MKKFLEWWYAISLPRRSPPASPAQREQLRYARLTAGILLLLFILYIPSGPVMIFFSPASPSSPPIGLCMLGLLATTWILGRLGYQKLSASCIIAYTFLPVNGAILTNPPGPSLLPLFSSFNIAIVLAGSLMPPIAALITGALGCIDVALLAVFTLTATTNIYNRGTQLHLQAINVYSLAIFLPIAIQIVVAAVMYVIMKNLRDTIRRADRAEEIMALQAQVAEHERKRLREKEQLEREVARLAETHARIANGDLNARVSLNEENVLWSVAVPLNNLLNRLQKWKSDSDKLVYMQRAAMYIAQQFHEILQSGQRRALSLTGTPLDPMIIEANKVLEAQPHLTDKHSAR
jgi:hypothetical protein